MSYIDTHCHINFNSFKNDYDVVIRRALSKKVEIIIVGTDRKSSQKALDLANRYQKGVFASAGFHPINITQKNENKIIDSYNEEFSPRVYEKFAKFEKVIAIGEIGLDYSHFNNNKNLNALKKEQKIIMLEQIRIAREQNLPCILHCRNAHDDMISILEKFRKEKKDLFPSLDAWGVIHCFSGNEDLAWKYFNIGLLISFTGIITFSQQWDNLLRRLPNNKFMIETDSPFLTPEPFRGKRNEPILVKHIAKKIGEIKHLSEERIGDITTKNAKKLFKIP